jgi:hypothetical protein
MPDSCTVPEYLFTCLPLDGQLNNNGVTIASDRARGGFNIWGNSFPGEELPASGSTPLVGAVPFLFPAKAPDGSDNVRCRGQRLRLPAGPWDWVHMLGAAERRTEDLVVVEHADGSAAHQWLRMSDFWPQTAPRFGEVLAFRCARLNYPRHVQREMAPAIWAQRIPVTRPIPTTALVLPDNPALHIFAVTLQAPA